MRGAVHTPDELPPAISHGPPGESPLETLYRPPRMSINFDRAETFYDFTTLTAIRPASTAFASERNFGPIIKFLSQWRAGTSIRDQVISERPIIAKVVIPNRSASPMRTRGEERGAASHLNAKMT